MAKGASGDAAKLPKVFYVNWFRRGEDGRFLWPGFGENSRVLKWIVERLDGKGEAVETAIGHVPTVTALDRTGLDLSDEDLAAVLEVDRDEWLAEIPQVTEWFTKFGDKLPAVLWAELDALRARLADA
jgi:phosphoenolpyruvate carboxykinase (GTP)